MGWGLLKNGTYTTRPLFTTNRDRSEPIERLIAAQHDAHRAVFPKTIPGLIESRCEEVALRKDLRARFQKRLELVLEAKTGKHSGRIIEIDVAIRIDVGREWDGRINLCPKV